MRDQYGLNMAIHMLMGTYLGLKLHLWFELTKSGTYAVGLLVVLALGVLMFVRRGRARA